MDEQHVKNLMGQRIKERRETLGISQVDLANQAEKQTATYIALIENGDRNVSTADLIKCPLRRFQELVPGFYEQSSCRRGVGHPTDGQDTEGCWEDPILSISSSDSKSDGGAAGRVK